MFLDLQFIADLICHCLPSLDVIESPVIKTLHVPYRNSSHLVTVVAGFSEINLACVKFLGCSRFTIKSVFSKIHFILGEFLRNFKSCLIFPVTSGFSK